MGLEDFIDTGKMGFLSKDIFAKINTAISDNEDNNEHNHGRGGRMLKGTPSFSNFMRTGIRPQKERKSYRLQVLPAERVWDNIINREPFLDSVEIQEDGPIVGYGFRLALNPIREKIVVDNTHGATVKTLAANAIAISKEEAQKITVAYVKYVHSVTKKIISNFHDLPVGVRMALTEYAYYRTPSIFEKQPEIRQYIDARAYDKLKDFIANNKPESRYKAVANLIDLKS